MKKLILLIISIFMLSFAFAKPNPVKQADVTMLKPGQTTLTLTLPSNATTGYHWFLIKTSKLLTLKSHQYIAPNTKLVGAPGQSIWRFSVSSKAYQAPMMGKVELVYARPWEANKAVPQYFYFLTQE